MRIKGRRLYPDNLAERRTLGSLGELPLVCPRNVNPYVVKRRLERAANRNPDVLHVRELLRRAWPTPRPSPEPDHTEPANGEAGQVGAAAE